jgi:hypothetical protein
VSAQREFILTWREWLRLARPTRNFRLGRHHAPTYAVECHLDHLISYLDATVGAFLGGKRWEHVERAADYLEDLHAMEVELERSHVPVEDSRDLREFIAATRQLLHAFIGWVRARGAV